MKSVKIIRCTCKNKGQDNIYGNDMRVFNRTSKSKNDTTTFRCTVCSKELDSSDKDG